MKEKIKKQMMIYIFIAYGVTFLMGLFMWYGYEKEVSLYLFPNVQMMYPAAGVMLAYLLTEKDNELFPRRFYITYLILTGVMAISAIISVFYPGEITFSTTVWMYVIQILILLGSILCWIMLLTEKKEKRIAVGLTWKNTKKSIWMIVLFVVLYMLRVIIPTVLAGETASLTAIFTNWYTWYMIAALFINFFLVFIAFFGEEYGWRYYLQPIMQKKFGKRWGVILLGVVWGLWHLPINVFYYSPETWLQSVAAQQITCITIGIFFAYAYMKSENILVPVILHFLNNNLIPIISGNYSSDVIANQVISWGDLLPSLIVNGVIWGGFLFSKVFQENQKN